MLTGKTTNKLMISTPKKRKTNKKVVVEDTVPTNGLCGTRVTRDTPLIELMSLVEGQLIEDEKGQVGTLLNIEIKSYRVETHIYLKLSLYPKMILIIK